MAAAGGRYGRQAGGGSDASPISGREPEGGREAPLGLGRQAGGRSDASPTTPTSRQGLGSLSLPVTRRRRGLHIGFAPQEEGPTLGGGAPPPSPTPAEDMVDPLHPQDGQDRERGGGQGVSGVSAVWQRLHRSGASQQAISLGWRLLHAALPVRSKVAHCLSRPLHEGLCEASGCGCQESLSHALMECSKVRGAIDWLLDLFEAITGQRPPRDPRVILADDHRVWEARGTVEERLLWQRLRLTLLSHIWGARSLRQRHQRRGNGNLSEVAISGAAQEIQRAIRTDWARTRLVETQEEAGGDFFNFSGRDPSLTKAAFVSLWGGNNVMCYLSSTAAEGLVVRDWEGWLPPRAGAGG